MTISIDRADDEFLKAAGQALRTSRDGRALDTLGWWELLAQLDDADSRSAVFALFRAQGRELASSAALGGLLAQPYLDAAGVAPGSVVATVLRWSTRRGEIRIVVGDVERMRILVDRPGVGAWVVDGGRVEHRPIELAGRLALHEVEVDLPTSRPMISERDASDARARSIFLGRLAASLEVLGAAEAALVLAIEHARNREQFGQPIGTFQAVRHLLAWAKTDCVALESVTAEAVALDRAAPARYDEIVKALAGRNGRRVCERVLQVLGGIGFTAEHTHHHFHGRVLALDGLLGTSADLTHHLGVWLRSSRSDPRLSAASLASV